MYILTQFNNPRVIIVALPFNIDRLLAKGFVSYMHGAVRNILHSAKGSSGGVVVKLLACGAGGRGSISGLAATISEISYLLLPSRDMAERSLKRRKCSKQPTSQAFS